MSDSIRLIGEERAALRLKMAADRTLFVASTVIKVEAGQSGTAARRERLKIYGLAGLAGLLVFAFFRRKRSGRPGGVGRSGRSLGAAAVRLIRNAALLSRAIRLYPKIRDALQSYHRASKRQGPPAPVAPSS